MECDLGHFYGPRGSAYLAYFRRRRPGFPLSWSWPAFGSWIAWFGYRRLWRAGLVALVVPLIADYVAPGVGGLLTYIAIALLAKEVCLRHAFTAVAAADRQGLVGDARAAFLRDAGTVSWAGAIGGTVLVFGLAALWTYLMMDQILQQLDAAGLLQPLE
jgi:hypothetical protein